jgi:hypothetical protein
MVVGDAEQPGRKGRLLPKPGQGNVGLQENLLGEILRSPSLSNHPIHEVEHHALVLSQEVGKRLPVPGQDSIDQLVIPILGLDHHAMEGACGHH